MPKYFPHATLIFAMLRYLNDQELEPGNDVEIDVDEKAKLYHLTLLHDLKGKDGEVKVTAKNGGGEDSCASKLVIGGRAPKFIEKPLKCTVLDGKLSSS